jgi:phosphoribosylamine--glycine ligase
VFVAPGNAGTAVDAENVDISPTDFVRLIKFVRENEVALTVVGPEAPLVAGIVDVFQKEKLKIFGPTKLAAELEGSKVFCKNLLRQADVPTADYQVFRDPQRAITYLRDRDDVPVVVKADGLAGGKGVFVCRGRAEAIDAVSRIARTKEFGDAGNHVVIEERLDAQEASVLAITDGRTLLTLPAAQDHKAAYDGDQGPNTGGMGAYCPTPMVSAADLRRIEEQVLVPIAHAMKRSRRPFRGVLYAGLMMTNQGPKVLEFNVRFGDPECQALLLRCKSGLVDVLEAAAEGRLSNDQRIEWDTRPSVCVVMAAAGYPGEPERGQIIRGLDEAAKVPDVKVFHAGTLLTDGKVVTNGGRVLGVTSLGATLAAAKLSAYTAVKQIRWEGAWCRKDISDKALGWK